MSAHRIVISGLCLSLFGCAPKDDPTCEFKGEFYNSGEVWDDFCNTCTCKPSGEISCTAGHLYGSDATYIFTSCGQSGRFGPSQEQCIQQYAGTNLEDNLYVNDGIQEWLVPRSGLYKIEVWGAQGGNDGGRGAGLSGEFTLVVDEKLSLIIGQQGETNISVSNSGGGGGGGSFVFRAANNPVIIAGGGGGQSSSFYTSGVFDFLISDASLEESGKGTSENSEGINGGGTDGEGGAMGWMDCCLPGRTGASGGGGFLEDGLAGSSGSAGMATNNGGDGGSGSPVLDWNDANDGHGGFGGGGGTTYDNAVRSGGGGGYSGGQGGSFPDGITGYAHGGGGGSYNTGENQINTEGVNTGSGLIIISLIQ